jgi:hypothetical protein
MYDSLKVSTVISAILGYTGPWIKCELLQVGTALKLYFATSVIPLGTF